jgi:hypothetical protein
MITENTLLGALEPAQLETWHKGGGGGGDEGNVDVGGALHGYNFFAL